MFNCKKLNKAYEATEPFLTLNKQKMNNISDDIKKLQEWLSKHVSLADNFSMHINFDKPEEDGEYLLYSPSDGKFKYCSSGVPAKNVMECKFHVKRLVHENLPRFLIKFAESLPNFDEENKS